MTPQKPTNSPMQVNRRQFHRRIFQGSIEIEWGSTVLTGTVRDIGPRGLFVKMTSPLWIGATFTARLLIDPILQLHCIVRRVEPGSGVGLMFEEPQGSAKLQLDQLLANLPEI
jgi:hypothetical protein